MDSRAKEKKTTRKTVGRRNLGWGRQPGSQVAGPDVGCRAWKRGAGGLAGVVESHMIGGVVGRGGGAKEILNLKDLGFIQCNPPLMGWTLGHSGGTKKASWHYGIEGNELVQPMESYR